MKNIKHWAIYFTGKKQNPNYFINRILKGNIPPELKALENKKGVFFSTVTLEKFIKEEKYHDRYVLTNTKKRSIQTFSSGEQRKALFYYLTAQNPDYIILDHVFDMLDVDSRKTIQKELQKIATTKSVIQIVNRNKSLLPFIKNAIIIEDDIVKYSGAISEMPEHAVNSKDYKLQKKLPKSIGSNPELQNPLVHFKNVTVKYGNCNVVKNINWKINKNEFWQLKGPNGAGKTTLLTMITGDNTKAYNQELYLFGRKRGTGESIWDIKKNVGYITPAMVSMFRGWNTAEKMIISGITDSIGLYKNPTQLQRFIADDWIDLLDMNHIKQVRYSSLPETQKRMVLIARAMIKHPPILILDEPALGLNDYNASILSTLVNKIFEEGQTSIIYVSHKQEPGLTPNAIYELIPDENGYVGKSKNL